MSIVVTAVRFGPLRRIINVNFGTPGWRWFISNKIFAERNFRNFWFCDSTQWVYDYEDDPTLPCYPTCSVGDEPNWPEYTIGLAGFAPAVLTQEELDVPLGAGAISGQVSGTSYSSALVCGVGNPIPPLHRHVKRIPMTDNIWDVWVEGYSYVNTEVTRFGTIVLISDTAAEIKYSNWTSTGEATKNWDDHEDLHDIFTIIYGAGNGPPGEPVTVIGS